MLAQECRNKVVAWQKEIEDLEILKARMDLVDGCDALKSEAKQIRDSFESCAGELQWAAERAKAYEELRSRILR